MSFRRPRRPRLRTRVLAGVLAVTLVALVAFDIAAVTALRGYLIGQTDAQLQSVLNVYRVVDAILPGRGPAGGIPRPRPSQVQRTRFQRSAIPPAKWRIHGRQVPTSLQPFSFTLVTGRSIKAVSPTIAIRGLVLETNPALVPRLTPETVSQALNGGGTTVPSRNGNQLLRLMAMPVPGRQGILVAATSLDGVNQTAGQLALILIIASAAAGLLAAGGVAWVMRRGLRPIETMAVQADAITAGDLTSRVSPHDTRTEVGRLGTALNGMLGRIDAAMRGREASQEATRRFFADASHELRNPLASLRANAELYQQGALRRPQQVGEAMRRIAHEAQRMSALVDDMLRLARLDQQPSQHAGPVDVTALVTECAERAGITDADRTWHTCIAPGLTAMGDEELLRRAIDNLLGNVRAHTPGGTTATLTAARCDGSIAIEVSDDGPGVPPAQLARIFDRFYRGGPAAGGPPGSGLGLAIVNAVAATHHGTAQASLNDPHGLRVTLTLPACPPVPGAAAPVPHTVSAPP
jgi:two-component system, OmpR family, sensor kinase